MQSDPCNCDQALDYQRMLEEVLQRAEDWAKKMPGINNSPLLRDIRETLDRWNPVVTVEVVRTIPAHVERVSVDIKMGEVIAMRDEDGRAYDNFPTEVVDRALKKLERSKRRSSI